MAALLTPALWCFLLVWLLWRMEIMVKHVWSHKQELQAWSEAASRSRVEELEERVDNISNEIGKLTKSSTPDKEITALRERLDKVEQTVTMLALGS